MCLVKWYLKFCIFPGLVVGALTLSWDAGQQPQPAAPRQPHDHTVTDPNFTVRHAASIFLDVLFSIFTAHRVYKKAICARFEYFTHFSLV